MKRALQPSYSSMSCSTSTAVLQAAAAAVGFVASLYTPFATTPLPRNHWEAIARRAVASGLAVAVALGGAAWRVGSLTALGLVVPGRADLVWRPLVLVAMLFAGPLVFEARERRGRLGGLVWPPEEAVPASKTVEEEQRHMRWVAARNYVVAPVLEELAFRAAVLPILIDCGGVSPTVAAFVFDQPRQSGITLTRLIIGCVSSLPPARHHG